MKHFRLTRTSFFLLTYLFCLYAITSWSLFRWPIVAYDNDLWFHLNGGRYLFSHHALPPDSFFSFLNPPRPWVNYAWLFQALAYAYYSVFRYEGFIMLRAAMYLLCMSVILLFLFTRRNRDTSRLYLVTLFVMYWFLFLPRYLVVRPHIFTYLWTVLLLWVFEDHPRRIPWLVVVGIVWCNLHGITYPVMLLVSGAYLLECLAGGRRLNADPGRSRIISCLPVVLLIATVFVTPYGWNLITLPSTSAAYASGYIAELKPIDLEHFGALEMVGMIPSQQTLFNLLLAATGMSLIAVTFRRQLRVSHVLLLAGGIIGLLSRGQRAVFECALFALPILRDGAPGRLWPTNESFGKGCAAALGIILVAFPVVWLQFSFGTPPKYPFSRQRLPYGVATFLNHVDAHGSVLNFLNSGGYLEWALYPRYKIFADMDVPFFFTDEDVFTAKRMFRDGTVLRNVLLRYDPSFVTVPIILGGFPELIRSFPDYRAVFFDDAEVLYVNQRHYPAIAATYALQAIDPYLLLDRGPSPMLGRTDRIAFMQEARRLLTIDPGCALTNQLVSVIYSDEGAYDRALVHAEMITQTYPESVTGYGLQGYALQGMGASKDAVRCYRQALRRVKPGGRKEVLYHLGVAYQALGQSRRAYAVLRKAVDPFAPDMQPAELTTLAKAALDVGKIREAKTLAQFAVLELPSQAVPQLHDEPSTEQVNQLPAHH